MWGTMEMRDEVSDLAVVVGYSARQVANTDRKYKIACHLQPGICIVRYRLHFPIDVC